ncbi:SH3 and multiple ankyrin repeat domains protein 1 isoform X5 [Drosophila eugracilis]|uniref:SH3 and multiple ankyrin repeat domains protein 1 isoform X5 n=1 Tax=Drosophila eugracilis TaxID=29029 RepID=UPI0007E63AC5|nr:SH3 and multiple ankyrin repeat domains protein 1 isoform X5 [Drosophila eugracilis]
MSGPGAFDDEPPPEPRDGWLLVRIHVPELNVYKCLQFPSERLVWDVKQQVLASLPKVAFWFKELKESFNYGLFAPPANGKAGKFLDEERRLGDYPFNGPVGYLELKYKRRVYKMLTLDERQLKALHTRANLRRFLECINGGHVEKIAKMCAKGLDPNFHCSESGDTPLTVATGAKKPNKLLIALVNGGALLDYRTKDGTTALHRAVEHDSLEAVSTLLELGASPNYRDGRGITPLYISITRKCEAKITESLLHDHATLGIQDSQGWNEVHQACRHGLVQHLEHLLFYGADMDGRNASGNSPLHVCAVNNQEACARMLLFRGAQRGAQNFANQTPYQVAVIAGNLELAEIIENYKSEDIDKSLGDTSDIISDSSGVGTNSDSAACSIGHPSTTVVCMEPYAGNTVGHIRLQPGDVIEVVGSTDCGLLEGYVRGTNQSGFFPADCVQEVSLRQKHITNVMTASTGMAPQQQQQQQQHLQQAPASSAASYQGSPQLSLGGHSGSSSTLLQQPHQSPSLSVASNGSCQQPGESNGGGASGNGMNSRNNNHSVGQYSSATAPRIKKSAYNAPRSVVLHRAKRGFGFILRGAKASSQLMQLRPSERFPALQYLDDVDPGGVADMAGLRPGDFLLTINGEDVSSASHEQVVEMIRSAGALVNLTVVSPQFPHQMQASAQYLPSGARAGSQHLNSGPSTPQSSHRQCATLPRKMTGPGGSGASSSGGSVRMAPMPPRRDPKTTLSVGRARAKSMVAGLENGGEKEDELPHTKSNSVESIATPAVVGNQTGPGTPVQLRTASIKARPTSSRITAAELEELFQRQQGEGSAANASRYATMMTSSRFQSGTDSGAATPPAANGSPMRSGPLVYGSVAEMKRKAARSKHGSGTLRGKPVATPTVGAGGAGGGRDLKRFHSTPDLHGPQLHGSASSIWQAAGKGHHSQDDVATLHASLQRLNSNQAELKLGGGTPGGAVLPPPNHPPPPPPVGQVVKVETRSSVSEYESTISLQQKLKKRAENDAVTSAAIDGVQSSFNPSANAKIYASPQELRNVMAWKLRQAQEKPTQETSAGSQQPVSQYAAPTQMRPPQQQQQQQQQQQPQQTPTVLASHYAAPQVQVQVQQVPQQQPQQPAPQSPPAPPLPQSAPVPAQNGNGNGNASGAGNAPPIPEPDYSCSESDGEDENSILVARNTKLNEKIALFDVPETSGNSQASGSSSNSGSASISHSLSVEEIQRIRSNLKTSKSSPNGFAKKPEEEKPQEQQQSHQQPQQQLQPGEDECDNSSSGVSSEQEQMALAAGGVTLPVGGKPTDTIKKKPSVTIVEEPKTIPDQPISSNTSHTTKPMAKTTISIGGGGASVVPTATLTVKQLVQQQHAPAIQQQQQQLGSKQPVTVANSNKFTQQSNINSNVMSPQVLGRIPNVHHHQQQQQSSNPNQKLIATQQQILQQQQQQLAHQQHLQQILKAKAAAAGGASNTAALVAKHQQKLHKGTSSGHESEMETRSDLEDDDGDLSPSPPAKAFQRHNSLTRKQAAAIAMQRGATRTTAVSLMQLPPPLEADSDGEPSQLTLQRQQAHHPSQTHPHSHPHQLQQLQQQQLQQQQQQQPMAAHIVGMLPSGQLVAVASGAVAGVPGVGAAAVQPGNNNLQQLCTDNLVLAPPPQFCDCNDAKHAPQPHLPTSQYHPQQQQQQQHQQQQQQQQQQQLQQQLQQQQMLQMHQRLSGGAGAGAVGTLGRVRIVGAMPKANHHRLH